MASAEEIKKFIDSVEEAYKKNSLWGYRPENIVRELKEYLANPTGFAYVHQDIEWYLTREREELVLDEKERTFSFDAALTTFLATNPFIAEISRWIRKVPSKTIPTAGVGYNKNNDDIVLYYNRRFAASITKEEFSGVLLHEFYHVIFRHVTSRRREPHMLWNIATDLAINSILVNNGHTLPKGALIPGVRPEIPASRDATKEEKVVMAKFADLIAAFPHFEASDVYFERLMQLRDESGNSLDKLLDCYDVDHSTWEEIPEELKQAVEQRIKNIVRRGVKVANGRASGWGNIPQSLREEIRASVDDVVDWKAILRNFVGMFSRGGRSTSIKKINKRYAYVHPGVKRGHVPRLAVAIDQSGSVDDLQIEEIFGVLGSLTKLIDITVIPFDFTVDVDNIIEWKKGMKMQFHRSRCGGTNFDAPTDYVNDPERRGQFDGLLICTDGECCAPGPSRVSRAFVVTRNHQLMFPTDDLVIQINDVNDVQSGAWK